MRAQDGFLSFRLSRLANVVRAAGPREYLTAVNLSWPEWRLLASLATDSPTPLFALRERADMDKGQASRCLKEMADRGLVKARLMEPFAHVIVITAKGRALYQSILPRAISYEKKLRAALTRAERSALDQSIGKLLAMAGET